MSADNGIYIVKVADNDFRAAYASAIDNVDYYIKNNKPEKAFDYWRNAPSFKTKEEADAHAREIEEKLLEYEDDFFFLEYGVCYLGDFSSVFSSFV